MARPLRIEYPGAYYRVANRGRCRRGAGTPPRRPGPRRGSRPPAPLGRFLTRDPIEEAGGLNLYGFCSNDGVNRFDLLGMDGEDVFDRIRRTGGVGSDGPSGDTYSRDNPFTTTLYGSNPDRSTAEYYATHGKTTPDRDYYITDIPWEGQPEGKRIIRTNLPITPESVREFWNRRYGPNSVIAESSNRPGSIEARVNASIRQEMGTKLNQGLIHAPTAAQAAEIAKLQAGLGTFSNAELAKVAGELKGRVFFIDDSLNVPETAKNPKTTFGYTYPDLYPKTIFLNPTLFKDDSFRMPDASGQKSWIYSVGETTIHENLHLRYGEQGINDPGGAKAHAIMDQYQERIFNAIMKEAYGP
jgi:hypothetical protein